MADEYYDRDNITYLDGTRIFKKRADTESEKEMARIIEAKAGVQLTPLGDLSPVDWVANQHGRVVGFMELKTRSHKSTKYPTVFLNVRKWLALLLVEVGTDAPSIFLVRFKDRLMSVRIREVDASKMKMGGCKKIVKSDNDIEPVIEGPISSMKTVEVFEK